MSGGMFDDLIPKPAAGGMFDDLIPQAGGTDVPAMARAPGSMGTPEEPGFLARHGRNLMLGTQAVGRGLAETAATLPNLAGAALNLPLMAADMVADKAFGSRVPFRFNQNYGEGLANATEAVVNAAGVPTFEPETRGEKFAYNVGNYGTQGLVGGFGLAKIGELFGAAAKPVIGDRFIRPYLQGDTAKVVAGDAVSGGGAGAALTASQEAPQEIRDAGGGVVGPLLDYLAMTMGGVGANVVRDVATGTPPAIVRGIRNSMADRRMPLDPETGMPFTRGQTEEAARRFQGRASDPAKAAGALREGTDYYNSEGLPMPTSGLMSGDIGLIGQENAARTRLGTRSLVGEDGPPDARANFNFAERDAALKNRAISEVESLSPVGSDPAAFTGGVKDVLDDRLAQRTGQANTARTAATDAANAEAGLAANINRSRGQDVAASTAIDQTVRETRNAEVRQKNALYNNPELTAAEVPVDPMRQTAGELGAADTPAAPLAPVVRKYVDRFGAIDEGTPITMREVNANRAEIEADIAANLDNGEIVRQLREMKATVNRYADELAATDGPAAEAAAAANANYRERFQPNFRQGAGGQFDRALKTERAGGTPVRPSETAETFLTSPEGTADLMRIAALRGNEQATAQQARTWLFDQLARKSVTQDGRLNPNGLANWQTDNRALLRNIPGLDDEVTQLLVQARNGRALSDTTTAALREAETRLRGQEGFNRSSTVGKVGSSDPERAVATALTAADRPKAMREIVGTIGFNREARAGLKNAVSSYLIKNVQTDTSTIKVNPGRVFDENRAALAEVFDPEEMNRLQRAQKLVAPLAKRYTGATVGSQTAERTGSEAWLPVEAITKLYFGMLKGGGIISNAKKVAGALSGGQDRAVQRIVDLAQFDPESAQQLLTMKTAKPDSPTYNAALQKLIKRNELLIGLSDDDGEEEPRKPLEITIRGRKPDGEQQK